MQSCMRIAPLPVSFPSSHIDQPVSRTQFLLPAKLSALVWLVLTLALTTPQGWSQGVYPATESFSGSGALSSNWTSTTASGFVALSQSAGTVQPSVASQTGMAIYTGTTFTNDQYAQATFVNHSAAGGMTAVCVRAGISGNGVCYVPDWGTTYAMQDGVENYTIISGCPVPASGDKVQLLAVGNAYTCKDVTTGVSASGSDGDYSLGSPAIIVDQLDSTVYALSAFQADCSPSCGAFTGSGAATYPLADAFSGSGALSSNWASVSNDGYEPLSQSGSSVQGTSGQAGIEVYTGAVFSDDQYAQVTLNSSSWQENATGVCVRMDTSGNGVCYLANYGLLYELSGGGGVDAFASCPVPSNGDVISLSVVGNVYTCTDRTSGVYGIGVSPVYGNGNPAILLDWRSDTADNLSSFQADCVPSCSAFANPPTMIQLGSYASGATNPGFANTATVYVPSSSAVNNGVITTYALSSIPDWHSSLDSSTYISYDPGTPGAAPTDIAPNGDYYYSTTFNLGSGVPIPGATGTLTILADDTVAVSLNGSPMLAAAGPMGSGNSYSHCSEVVPNCVTPLVFNLTGLVSGLNTLTFDVKQVNLGGTGLDYIASITYPSSGTPTIAVSPGTATLYASNTQQFSATVTGLSSTAVTWSISPSSGSGTISSAGLYTAPSSITSQQTVTATATSQANSSYSATATVTLMPPVAVTVTPPTSTLYAGQTQQLSASVANTSNTAVTWSISPSGAGSISTSGLYTAPPSLSSSQTVTATATSVANSAASASAIISLNPGAPPSPATCAGTGYIEERAIVIDHKKVAGADQINFPFLFSSTDPAFATVANGGKVTSSTGADILFTLDPTGTEKLDYEIQSYDPVHGQITAWVRIPTLSHTTTTAIYLFYGNSNISISPSNPSGVWDSNYQSVYHLANLSSSSVPDSTAHANNGTATSLTATTGLIGGAASFNGSTSIIQLPAGVTGSSPRTISAWVKSTSQAGCIYCSGRLSSSPFYQAFSLYANEQRTGNVYLQTYGSDNYTSSGTLPLNVWDYVTLSYSGGPTTTSSMALYINGSFVNSYAGNWNTTTTPNTYNGDFTIGLDPTNNNLPFSGSIAEVNVSSTARSASWIQTEYQNQSSPSTFYTLYAAFPGNVGIVPSAVSLYGGQAQQLSIATGGCASPGAIWSGPAGMLGTLSQSGFYVAPVSIDTQQTFTLTATTLGDASKTVSATVTLLPPVSISVTPPSATLTAGQTQQFTANVANASNTNVTWTIGPVVPGSISSTGLYTAPSSITTAQSISVTVTSQADPSLSATATVTLSPTTVSSGTGLCSSNGYGAQRTIVIDHTKVPNTDQKNFPFLFNSTDTDLATTANGGHVSNANGYDIYFSLDPNGLTKLDHEIEQYNPATGQLTAWIRIPTLLHTADTIIYLFYGNSNITTPQANPTGVWDKNYQAVYHLGNVASTGASDSTAFGNSGALTSVVSNSGLIDGAAGFNGTGSYIQIPSAAFPNYPTGAYVNIGLSSTAANTTFASTFGVWFKTSTAGGLLSQVPAQSCSYIFGFCVFQINTEPGYYDPFGWNSMLYVDDNGKVEAGGITSSAAYTDNNWHYAALTHATDGTKILYVDGQNAGVQERDYTGGYNSAYSYFAGTAYTFLSSLGNWDWLYLNGSLDEVSVSDIPRSGDWIKTQFNNQGSPSTFYSLSPVGSILLVPSASSLYASQSQQFDAAGLCSSDVSWSLSSGSPGVLTSTGLYTAPGIVSSSQTATITATNTTTGTAIGSATVTLLPTPNPITLAANIAPPYIVGTGEIFTARLVDQMGNPEAGVPVIFTITGSNAAIATAATDSSGTATFAYAGSNSGTDTIRASAVVNGIEVNSSALTISWNSASTPPVQASITLLPQPILGQGGLVGAFTDNTGAVVEPIAIGAAARTFIVPAGATHLQLGINDTLFLDNGGAGYVVKVNGTPVTVLPTSMPWNWTLRGLNGNLQFGFSDGTSPVVAATGLTAGQSVTIAYQSGTVSVGATARAFTDANGDQTQITGTNISAGLYFPTLYTTASVYPVGEPITWSALVTDASGLPVAGTSVAFSITGANAATYSATTDSTGVATFLYTGAYSGADALVAQSGSLTSETGNIAWQNYPAESSPGSVNLSLFGTDVNLQDWNVYATDASGNPVANANVGFYVSGVDNFQQTGTTDITGHVSFGYFHSKSGPYTVVAVDSVNDTVVKSSTQSGIATVLQSAASNNGSNQIAISVSTATSITLPTSSATLTTTITDSSGLTPTVSWTQVSGPGTATFASPTLASTTVTFSGAGTYVLQITATDTSVSATDLVTITVNPVPAYNYAQGWFGSPLYGSQATGIIPVTVGPGTTLTGGTLVYYPENDIFDVTVLNSNTTGSGQIGLFDTTQLPNGSYVLELYATNSLGVSQYNDIAVNVVGSYKPGRVTSTITDLVVPATGLAISIQRQYDSLNAAQSMDFGYGWSLGTNVGLTVDAHNDVTFTLNGQAHTFTFAPQPLGSGFFSFGVMTAAFTPDSGIHGTLTDDGQGCPLDIVQPFGALWYCQGGGLYQPSGYIYTDPSGTQYAISANGNLQSVMDIGGNTLTVTANGITSSTGLSVPFVRDSHGRITQITDPQGNSYLYTYDSSGNLATVKYPGITQTSSYAYDSSHRYLSGTDFRGNALPTSTYYGSTDTDVNGLPLNGRLKTVTDALSETTGYAYNLVTNATTITYPTDGSSHVGTATMVYDAVGNLLTSTDPNSLTTTNTYDTSGNLLSATDPLTHATTYTYDALGNRTSTTYPATATSTNTTSHTTYNEFGEPTTSTDELGNVRTYNYDANSWPASVTDGLGTLMSSLFNPDGTMSGGAIGYDVTANPLRASVFTYDATGNRTGSTDALGRITLYSYNSLGQKTSMTEPYAGSTTAAQATTTYTYDALGHLTQTAAPLGRTTSSTYDANGNKLSDTDADGNTTTYSYDALNRLTTTTYPTSPATTVTNTYDFRGNILTQTDQAGNVTKSIYDVGGRLTSTTKAYGTANAMTTSYAYYDDGRKLTATDPAGHVTKYVYDQAGRLLSVTSGYGATGASTTSYGYDDAGNRTSMTDGNSHTTTYQYDARKRLTKTTYPDTKFVTNTYDGPGNLASVTDQAGNVVSYTYDAANQLQTVVQTPGATAYTTGYGYDLLGNLGTVQDANSHTTTNSYDLLSELNTKVLPDGTSIESRAYDYAGNLTSVTHFNGVTTAYTYDSLNRLTSRSTPSETTVSFTYTATGKRHTMADASGTTTYGYDYADRLTSKATPAGTLSYTYDAAGNVASIASSNTNGASMSYTWDSLNRLSTVVDNRLSSGHNTTTYTYDTASNLVTVTYPNGLVSTLAYDAVNRMMSLATVTSGSSPVASYNYAPLGATGIRTQAAEAIATSSSADTRKVNWSYDNTYRLTQEQVANDSSVNGTVSYGLDPVGNRAQETSSISGLTSTSLAFNADDLISGETYDANGNTTGTGGKTFAYDSENHLVSMNSGAVTLVYDGDGNRVSKTVSGVTTQYLVDDLNPTGYPQVMEELVGGSVARTYTYGLQRISEEQVISSTWTPSFYGYDGGGTVRQLTNSSGAVTDTYNYDAFGNRLNSTGSTPNEFLYRGEQYDPDLGLYYLRARYMNPATGRFMSRDPIDGDTFQPVALHKYLYVGGDPINWLDPSGKAAILEYRFTIGGIGIRVALDPANHLFPILGKLYECIHLQLNTWIVGQKGSDWVYRIPLIPLCVAAGP